MDYFEFQQLTLTTSVEQEFHMALSVLFYINLNLIPDELALRDYSVTLLIGAGLFLSFLLVSTARLMRARVFATLIISFTKIRGLSSYVRDTHKLNKREAIVLYVNYLLTFGLVFFVFEDIETIELENETILAAVVPVVMAVWPIICMLLVGFLTGESKFFVDPIMMKIIGAQLLGAIYFICVLIWALNFIDGITLIQIVFWIFIIESTLRIIKSIWGVYNAGASWYYIILYLCTLEILPLWLIGYSLLKEFNIIELIVN